MIRIIVGVLILACLVGCDGPASPAIAPDGEASAYPAPVQPTRQPDEYPAPESEPTEEEASPYPAAPASP